MSDSGTQPSATDSPLGRTLNGGDISGALAASQQNQDFLKKAALALPTALKASRDDEAAKSRPILDKINDLTEAEIAQIKGPPPQPQATNVAEQWGSPAMLLAVIGSAFTRQPLINALNAGAAVMKGFQQRDYDAAQTAFKNWKEANDTSLKLMSIQRESYADALKAIEHSGGEDRKDAMATFTALAHAFGDKPTTDALAVGRYDLAGQIAADRETHYNKMETGAKKATQQFELTQAIVTTKATLDAAKKGGDPAAIEKAQADYDAAVKSGKDWQQAESAVSGKGGETDTQATRNAEIGDARDKMQRLLDGEAVQYGGVDLTAADLKAANQPAALIPGVNLPAPPTPQTKAIQKMRAMASTPIVKGTTAEPVPTISSQPKATPGAAPRGEVSAADQAMLKQAADAVKNGAPRDAVRERYIEAGGNAADFDATILPPVPSGGP